VEEEKGGGFLSLCSEVFFFFNVIRVTTLVVSGDGGND
jgi:hypothetical protein